MSLAELRDVVLMFWNPSCGFCRSLRDELRDFEIDPPIGARELVLLADGEPADVRGQAFSSVVLHDEAGAASRRLRSAGTPSALLIDADGQVASARGVGAEEVLRLLRNGADVGGEATDGDAIALAEPRRETSRRGVLQLLAALAFSGTFARAAGAATQQAECLPGHYPCLPNLCCLAATQVCCPQDPLSPCCDRRTSVCEDKCRDRCPKGWSACGKGEAAGKTGCCRDDSEECVGGRCLPKCPPGATRCGTNCCARGYDCVGRKCVRACPDGSPRCGKKCCAGNRRCADPRTGRCTRCGRGQEACGRKCCPKGSYCCDERKGLCCPKGKPCCPLGPYGGPNDWVCCPEECGDETFAKDGGFARSGARTVCCERDRYVKAFGACCPPGWKVLTKPTFGIEWCCPAQYECNGVCCTNPITTKGLPPELAQVCRNGRCVSP